MRIYIFILSIIGFTGISSHVAAQHENVWAFGNNAGIDFNTNPPTAIRTAITTTEGCASFCNDQGQLLFYTDGTSVWRRDNSLMPNGSDLTGRGNITASTSQGALIVPVPGNQDKYYIFSLGQFFVNFDASYYLGRLSYSIVDMSRNSGMGDVTIKGILVDSLLTEHMTAVSGNDCNIWLIVVSRLNNNFKVYNIDANGIHPQPVISRGMPEKELKTFSEIAGTIDIAPDRSKLAITQNRVILYDFDPDSGKITHPVILDTGIGLLMYGLCFSPDNTKLYASFPERLLDASLGDTIWDLCQYDLSSGDSMTMVQSKTSLRPNTPWGRNYALKRGPDGKIYSANLGRNYVGIINYPNLAGTACQFIDNGFSLFPQTACQTGLPNLATASAGSFFNYTYHYSSKTDTVLCSDSRITLSAGNLSGQNYIWEDSSTGSTRTVSSPGIYLVKYHIPTNAPGLPCRFDNYVDTFKVVSRYTTRNIYTTTRDSRMCKTDTIVMQASNLEGINYTWEDGSAGKQRKVNRTGIYRLSYQIDSICENYVDSFIITYPEKEYEVSFSADTLVCQNETVSFQNTSDAHFNHFNWLFGDQDSSALIHPQHAYNHPGSYRVMLVGRINATCPADTAYQTIVVDANLVTYFEPRPKEICTGQDISFIHSLADSSIINLYWSLGDGIYAAITDTMLIHHYEHPGVKYITLDARFRACPAATYMDSVQVHPLPLVDLGADSVICLKGTAITLKNLHPDEEAYSYLWSTGAVTKSIQVTQEGEYRLQVSNAFGCKTQEHIVVNKDCYIDIPNVFTPNGDGVNDYFFPRQLLSNDVTGFRMQILTRWGQKIFETTNTEGRGWDGRFNGQEQPAGVYVYIIEIMLHGRKERYEGNVTLLR